MILSETTTNPKYSIGKAKRPPLYQITSTPGPIYSQKGGGDLKFSVPPKWRIGNAERLPLSPMEKFDYYNYEYDASSDLGTIPKKWNHIVGGATSLDPRIKFDFTEKVPGPGRYEPIYESQKRKSPAFYLGMKLKSKAVSLDTGTGVHVGPGRYDTQKAKLTSQHLDFPKYKFGTSKRKGLEDKVWTKNESYYIYSSIGHQIMTQKPTMPIESFTRATRDNREKCGMFNSMMEKQPTKVRIEMPKF